jgi:hypothetical protein
MSNQFIIAIKKLCPRLVLILGFVGAFQIQAANFPDAQELMRVLDVKHKDMASLDQGKIISFDVAEDKKNELAAGVAIYLEASPAKIIQFINKKGLGSFDSGVIAQGSIPAQATPEAFKGFGFKAGSEEAKTFAQAEPGSAFNLSFQEFQGLRNTPSTQPDAASQSYWKILYERWQSYRKKGLKGIAPYDRGNGKKAHPGEELRTATQGNRLLAHYFPELYKAWLNYPAALPAGANEQFLWLNRKVEDRPTAILVHAVMLSTKAGEIILSRQFYVGHSYNSNQLSIACLPYRNGSLVFYANRNFTDQVAGLGSGLKRTIGRKQMKDEIVERLINFRKAIK